MTRGSPMTTLLASLGRPVSHGRADFHMHSTWSDGQCSYGELVDLCARAGLTAMAITDHDTLGAFEEWAPAARFRKMTPICGVEITAEIHQKEIHILAYWLEPIPSALFDRLEAYRNSRRERFLSILEKLKSRGLAGLEKYLDSDLGNPWSRAGVALGRRHVAEILIAEKHATSLRQAFDRYLNDPSVVGIPRERIPAQEAIGLVRDSGGITSWAHPPENRVGEWLPELVQMGISGLEAEYPDFKNSWKKTLRKMASYHGLFITGGSDCHGPGNRCPGSTNIGGEELESLLEALRKRNVPCTL